ncbi:flagellin [Sulfitobacter aestuariivivens]|uniref:Flagellar hook protein n=1 Tax=Sulfitobacter aestuariivivens TaxID=2766981 RepID=A0A927D6Y4_9RHOB|nr:flagellin [Sulfitobacter aestuariivivens]MBD3665526.1 flagellar hook protein [Sulfitobacter aestuariivivens]
MNTATSGDLAQAYFLRTRNAGLKQTIQYYTDQLATGQVSDLRGTVAGNYSFLTDVERKTTLLSGFKIATSEATQFTSAMQLALEHFADLSSNLSDTLLTAGGSAAATSTTDVAAQAHAVLDAMLGVLNTDVAGRHLFAGNATDQRPMRDSATLLADLTAAVSGAASPDDVMALATAWFDDPAGFETSMYTGGGAALSAFALSSRENLSIDVRANERGLKQALRNAAVAALANSPAFGFDVTTQGNLFALTGQDLLTGQKGIIDLQSRVGFSEANIDAVVTRNEAELTSLTLAKTALLEADPFDAATKLEEAQFQLQSLYSVTVRMSQLSLVNYL